MRPDSSIQWNAYPALLFAAALALGIAGPTLVPGVGMEIGFAFILSAIVLALVVRGRDRQRLVTPEPLFGTLAMLVGAMGLGIMLYIGTQGLPLSHIAHRFPAPHVALTTVLEGRVADDPTVRGTRTRFTLALTRRIEGDTATVSGNVLVSLYTSRYDSSDSFPDVRQGDIVQVTGRLNLPDGRRNPADFDYAGYLQRRAIYATISVYDPLAIVVQDHRRTLAEQVVTPLRDYIRQQLARFIRDEASRDILQALILGDRSEMDSVTRDHFARTGLMHLLAVSGLHVLLVGMVLYGLLGPFLTRLGMAWLTREVVRSVFTMAVLVVYLFVAGASASVMRAVVMAGIFAGGVLLQRSSHPLNTIGVAAVVVLLVAPNQLFEVGFQLSFAAVAAIVVLHGPAFRRLPEAWTAHWFPRQVASSVLVSLAATLGTLPVLLYHFGQVSFAGLFLNLIAIPLTAMTLAAGLMVVLLGGCAPWFADVFGAAANLTAQFLIWTAEYGNAWFAWLLVKQHVRDGWWLAAMVAMLVMIAQWPRPRTRWRLGCAAVGFGAVVLWVGVLGGTHTPRLDVIFFDVGHGDAALVRLPNGGYVLIDTGVRNEYTDQGVYTILPHMQRFGIRRLDAVVISHPHSDHLGGLPALLRSIPVSQVIHNGQLYESELYAETMHLLDSLRVPHRAVAAGDTLALDPTVRVQVLSPVAPLDAGANEASVVLRLVHGDSRFLFLGDAEAGAEHSITARYGDLLAANVIKVGHHGSNTSSTVPFVRNVVPDPMQPTIAVVSVARNSSFGLPDGEALQRWAARGAMVWTTAERGALWLRSDGQEIEQVCW